MADVLSILHDGVLEVEGRAYRIPDDFSAREVFSYRRLLEPIPDVPGGTTLTVEQREAQQAYFFRRAAACVIPGLETSALETIPLAALRSIHLWLSAHRPELALKLQMMN